ncbi:MAG: hypothetical protein EU530_04150 [Promethearchaeota archaeon]|nr:MAG: hypothetical protein EU530_04150 [Candidatus Lokiarchaeota archaeon]
MTDLIAENPTSGQADFKVVGDYRTFSIAEDPPHIDNWTAVQNPELTTFPDDYDITSEGMWVTHFWTEAEAGQLTSVHWTRNISMPVDMSDYRITSANISVIVNATVKANDGYGNGDGGVEAYGDYTNVADVPPSQATTPQFSTYDYVRFYSLVSDHTNTKSYEIAQYQTGQYTYPLGQDSYSSDAEYLTTTYDYLTDTYLFTVPEESLIFFLSDVLSTDNRNFNFTMGMKIWCEDNFLNDDDSWDDLLIKSYNLTFSYEKIIDRDTSASWSQVGNSIVEDNAQITNGIVKYDFKIDTPWEPSSPNSELRIRINGNTHNETIKLSSGTFSFQESKTEGFNVTKLLQKEVNITLSIELYLADEFALADNITVSITNVQLWVAYVLIEPPAPPPESNWPYLYGLMGGVVLLGVGFGAYEGHFKYPAQVRQIRNLKRRIRTGRGTKPLTKKDASAISNEIQASEKTQLQKKLKTSSTKSTAASKEASSKSYVEADKIKEPKPPKSIDTSKTDTNLDINSKGEGNQ